MRLNLPQRERKPGSEGQIFQKHCDSVLNLGREFRAQDRLASTWMSPNCRTGSHECNSGCITEHVTLVCNNLKIWNSVSDIWAKETEGWKVSLKGFDSDEKKKISYYEDEQIKALNQVLVTEWVAEEALGRGCGMKQAQPGSDCSTWLHGREFQA